MSQLEIREGARFAAQMLLDASRTPRSAYDERGPIETVSCTLEHRLDTWPVDYARGIKMKIDEVSHGRI